MNGLNFKQVAGLVLAAALSLPVTADDLVSAANDMCEKVKQCSIAEMSQAEMTPEMRQMIEPMLESMCDQMRQGVQEVPSGHELYQPSVACMRSMANLSCADFKREGGPQTPECEKYRKLAEEAYQAS